MVWDRSIIRTQERIAWRVNFINAGKDFCMVVFQMWGDNKANDGEWIQWRSWVQGQIITSPLFHLVLFSFDNLFLFLLFFLFCIYWTFIIYHTCHLLMACCFKIRWSGRYSSYMEVLERSWVLPTVMHSVRIRFIFKIRTLRLQICALYTLSNTVLTHNSYSSASWRKNEWSVV